MTTIAVFASQLGCLAMMIGVLFLHAEWSVVGLAAYLLPFMTAAVLVQVSVLVLFSRDIKTTAKVEATANVFD